MTQEEFKQGIQKAKELALARVTYFLEVEAEHAEMRDLKIATDVIKNIDTQIEDNMNKNVNVLVNTLATKFNLPNSLDEMKRLYK